MLKLTADCRRQGKLSLLLLTQERNSNAGHLKQAIKDFGIDCPVLFFGDEPRIVFDEWDIPGNPFPFLIDPQGVIVAKGHGALQTPELLDLVQFITQQNGDVPRARVRTAVHPGEGQTVDLAIELSSPSHAPLKVEVDYALDVIEHDAEGRQIVKRTKPNETGPELKFTVDCGEWGETVHQVSIDLTGYRGFQYEVRVLLPGTEDARDGQGFWARQRGWYYFDGENVNGEKN